MHHKHGQITVTETEHYIIIEDQQSLLRFRGLRNSLGYYSHVKYLLIDIDTNRSTDNDACSIAYLQNIWVNKDDWLIIIDVSTFEYSWNNLVQVSTENMHLIGSGA